MKYPRMCRGKYGPHLIEGPQHEHARGGGYRKCAACVNERHKEPKVVAQMRDASDRYGCTTKGILTRARAELSAAYRALESL